MNPIRALLVLGAIVIASCTAIEPQETADRPAQIPQMIFDTDFGGDADDLGAIAMLHYYADEGIIDLKAITSWSNEQYALPALAAVNQYYGRAQLPIGVRNVPEWRTDWNHTKVIADQFPHDAEHVEQVGGAVDLLRRSLAEASDRSITIVTVGPLANIANLLRSEADDISPLSGEALFDQKVDQLVIMGGRFPSDALSEGPEWNFNGNMPGVTQTVLETVKRPIILSGFEVGAALKVGAVLNEHSEQTPLFVGYKYFSEHAPWINADYAGEILDNSSFDQTAVMYAAIGGVGTYWTLSDPGFAEADAAGNNTWRFDPAGNHRFMILNSETQATAQYIAEAMMHVPD